MCMMPYAQSAATRRPSRMRRAVTSFYKDEAPNLIPPLLTHLLLRSTSSRVFTQPWMMGDKNMEKNNGKEKRAKELFVKEVQEEKANKVWEYNRNLLETSIDSLVTIGGDGIITDVNSATEKATGLPREKIIGTDFSEYFTEPDKARVGYKQVFDIGKVVDYELYLKHINGSSIPVLYNASVYKDNEGQIIGALAVARDISAIKKYEDELIDFKNNLELIVQQKTAELIIANKELAFQNEEKDKRAAELIIANKELVFQNEEKDK